MNTVMFDLDGTLLPLDEATFTKAYLAELGRKMATYGFEPEALIQAVWAGTKQMMQNDGAALNSERFWAKFTELLPCDVAATRAVCDVFYAVEFNRIKDATRPSALSAQVVKTLARKGYTLVLATNPLFPMVAVETRLRWLDLTASDFALITSYENSRFCKPNPMYYRTIMQAIKKQPEDCLMVGNNVSEDMCFAQLGGATYLVTDCIENPKGLDTKGYQQGSFAQFAQFVDALPQLETR